MPHPGRSKQSTPCWDGKKGAYAALGRDGQTIFVVPDLQLIVITTAQVDGHPAIFKLIEHSIVPAVSPATYKGGANIAVSRPVWR
jgi:hypothetical protein